MFVRGATTSSLCNEFVPYQSRIIVTLLLCDDAIYYFLLNAMFRCGESHFQHFYSDTNPTFPHFSREEVHRDFISHADEVTMSSNSACDEIDGLNKGRTWQQQPQNGLNNEGRPTLLNSNGGGVVVLMGPASSKLCDSIHCEHGSVCEIGGDSYPRCTCQVNI